MERSLMARRWGRVGLAGFVLVVGLLAIVDARGTGAAARSPVSPAQLCYVPATGELAYRPAGCPAGYRTLDLTAGPVDVCASSYTAQLRVKPNGGCPAGYRPARIGAGVDAAACANPYTGQVSYRASAAQACNGVPLVWQARRVFVQRCVDNYCPQAMPDKTTVQTPLWFRGVPGTIKDVDVTFDITHTSITDLEIVLESPAGTVVQLYMHHCYNAVDDLNVRFDDEAEAVIGTVCPPNVGSFRPAPGALSAFDGENPNGTWIVRIADTIQGDNGRLNDWSIEIEVK